ncbi:MAG: hypothetical protein IT236_11280 [Bacteroidia bacterium]|nr:hypothetical protein [Bacteroidia bacterium]
MCKLRQIFKNFLPGILLLVSASLLAQEDAYRRASELYKTNPELALKIIDSVIVHPQTQSDFNCWTLRGYIYYELYRKTDKLKLHSPLRDSIVSSILVSNKLKPDSLGESSNKKLLKNISASYYNLCTKLLQDSINYERSLIAYNKYKEIHLLFEPKANFDNNDIQYYLAVGSVYSDIFINDNNNTAAGEIAKVALLKVLDLQPENPGANINMGLMYYNQAAYLSKTLEFGLEFDQIDIVQENMIKLAKQAESFVIKVYNKDNNNVKAMECLFYVYRMLMDIPKSDEFKQKCIERGVKFETEPKKEGGKK